MSFKVFAGEVGVALHYVDHHRTPGFDIAGLGFVEKDEGSDNVSAETEKGSVCITSDGRR